MWTCLVCSVNRKERAWREFYSGFSSLFGSDSYYEQLVNCCWTLLIAFDIITAVSHTHVHTCTHNISTYSCIYRSTCHLSHSYLMQLNQLHRNYLVSGISKSPDFACSYRITVSCRCNLHCEVSCNSDGNVLCGVRGEAGRLEQFKYYLRPALGTQIARINIISSRMCFKANLFYLSTTS